MELTKKELMALGFNPYSWKITFRNDVYPMDDAWKDRMIIELSAKKIDIQSALDCVSHAHDCLNDRIYIANDEENVGGANLLKSRQKQFGILIRKIEKFIALNTKREESSVSFVGVHQI